MGNTIIKAAAVDFGIQWIAWAVAATLKTEKFYDLTGSLTYILITANAFRNLNSPNTRQKVNTGMVITWAVRLGSFLFTRVLRDGGDSRFNKVKHQPGRFWIYWTIQGLWVLTTLLPTLIVNSKDDKKSDTRDSVTSRDYAGWAIWTLGFVLEVIADHQKNQFKADPTNAGKFINQGLWSISRHPNYLGEIMMWSGLYISSTSVLKGWEHISIISPLFLTFLLTRVSGIPFLEAAGNKKWGTDPNYQEYLKNTARLIPYIW